MSAVLTRRKRNGPSAAAPPAPVNPLIPPVVPVGSRPGPNPGPGDGRVGILQPLGRHRRAAPGNAAGGLDPQAPRASTGRRARLPAPRGGRGRSECVGLPDARRTTPYGTRRPARMRSRARGGWRRRPERLPEDRVAATPSG